MDESLAPNLDIEDLRWLRRLARRLVRDPEDADDAVQDTVLAALTRAPDELSVPRGWLARVLQNVVREGHRGEARRSARERDLGAREPARSAAEVVEELAWHRTLVDHVYALDEPYRTTIVLRFLRGQSAREIAREQGVPVKTIHTRVERGLSRLRHALDREHGGDRSGWVSALAPIISPAKDASPLGALVLGGMAVGTMVKVFAAVLIAAICFVLVTRGRQNGPQNGPQPSVAVAPTVDDADLLDPTDQSTLHVPAQEAERRSTAAVASAPETHAPGARRVLRVVLEGTTEEYAQRSTVTVTAVEQGKFWMDRVEQSWPTQGVTSEIDLDPFLDGLGELRDDEFTVKVSHPLHFSEKTQVSLSGGVPSGAEQTVFEVRARLAEVVYWPELTLSVRDARSRVHLEDVELRMVGTAFMGLVQQPGASDPFTVIGKGLVSPIAMRGGRKAGAPEGLSAGVALVAQDGGALRPAELGQPEENERGVMMYARAPGYAWKRLVVDISKGATREVFLEPGAGLGMRVTNVQSERYAALNKQATLYLKKIQPDGSEHTVWSRSLTDEHDGAVQRIEDLEPGDYAALVELSGSWQRKPTEFGRETISLPAGETRELHLVLPDAPEPPEHATLAGTVSFPTFGGESDVRLELFRSDYRYGDPDAVLSMADLQPVTSSVSSWSFRLDDLQVGHYQVRLMPFLKSWMVELPEGGREDLALVIPELAEVTVETVDQRTGQRVPLEAIAYRALDVIPGQVTHGGSNPWAPVQFEGKPGTFRLWTVPGLTGITPSASIDDVDYVSHLEEFALAAGRQSIRLEVNPASILSFRFLVDGEPLPHEDAIFVNLSRCLRAVGHEGRVGGMYPYNLLQASAPGLYEADFEGVGTNRFEPIPPRRIEAVAGETTEVTIELTRK